MNKNLIFSVVLCGVVMARGAVAMDDWRPNLHVDTSLPHGIECSFDEYYSSQVSSLSGLVNKHLKQYKLVMPETYYENESMRTDNAMLKTYYDFFKQLKKCLAGDTVFMNIICQHILRDFIVISQSKNVLEKELVDVLQGKKVQAALFDELFFDNGLKLLSCDIADALRMEFKWQRELWEADCRELEARFAC